MNKFILTISVLVMVGAFATSASAYGYGYYGYKKAVSNSSKACQEETTQASASAVHK